MKKMVLLAAGVVLAAGTVAAVSAPEFRGHRRGILNEFGESFGSTAQRIARFIRVGGDNDDAVSRQFGNRRALTFERLDLNGDGVIDREEFDVAMTTYAQSRSRHMMRRDRVDGNGDRTSNEHPRSDKRRLRSLAREEDSQSDHAAASAPARRSKGRGRTDVKAQQGAGTSIDRKDEDQAGERSDRDSGKRDGRSTRDEFGRAAGDQFTSFDVDEDDQISEAELSQRMRGRQN